MKLKELLSKVCANTNVRVSENPFVSEDIYFGPVKEITLKTAADYEVVEVYPEFYPPDWFFRWNYYHCQERMNDKSRCVEYCNMFVEEGDYDQF